MEIRTLFAVVVLILILPFPVSGLNGGAAISVQERVEAFPFIAHKVADGANTVVAVQDRNTGYVVGDEAVPWQAGALTS